MEVPAKFRSVLVGFRYWLFSFVFLAIATLLVSCEGGSPKVTTQVIPPGGPASMNIFTPNDNVIDNGDGTLSKIFSVMAQDEYGNPVADGTLVYFQLSEGGGTPQYGFVCKSAVTGDPETSCSTVIGSMMTGVAHTLLTWDANGIDVGFDLSVGDVPPPGVPTVFDTYSGTYPGIGDTDITVAISPADVDAGSTGLTVTGHYEDSVGNPVVGATLTFESINPLFADFTGGGPVDEPTDVSGDATRTDLDTATCLDTDVDVEITVTDSADSSKSGSGIVHIGATAPIASFTTTGAGPGYNFTSTSTTPIGTLTYDWDFGDASPHDTTANPSYTYGGASPQSYTVTLTVGNGTGCTSSASTTVSY